MKLRTLIDNVHGRYEVQVETFGFTANELEQIQNFGEPLVEVGGAFSGSVMRPGVSNTVINIGGDGLGATAVPIVQGGSVTGATVTNLGTGYTVAPVTIAGDGLNAVGVAHFGIPGTTLTFGGGGVGSGHQVNDILTLASVTLGDVSIQLLVTQVGLGGEVEAVSILNRGDFTAVPANPTTTWTTSGSGIGFEASLLWGVVRIAITAGGTGYNVSPLPVAFTLPTATRRLRSDSPFKQIFDLEDDPDSDAKAKVWADTIVARCLSAKATLMSRTSPFEGETVITG